MHLLWVFFCGMLGGFFAVAAGRAWERWRKQMRVYRWGDARPRSRDTGINWDSLVKAARQAEQREEPEGPRQ